VLPSQYDTLTRISLPLVFVLAIAQALFFWNVIQTMRGKAGVATFDERGIPVPSEADRGWSGPAAEAGLVLAALALAFAFAVGGYLVGRETGGGGGEPTVTEPTGTGGTAAGDPENGKELFASGGCHVLADAGAAGEVGPSLDGNTALTEALVVARVTNGQGAMPAFGDQLDEEEIADITAYILQSAAP
jgi:mono/diheme cytochrome c family protein